jgi:hypothetical protein
MRTGINNLTEDELREADDALNRYSFEKYCGACINFNTEDCPNLGKVCETTEWSLRLGASRKGMKDSREIIKCNKFYD